ncbi:hypothetical protein J1N35_018811 [Gossypium stocksii]|uniref:Uncharacterized protein n=1 Tax=Gossypium stocksii TaxID=47602 RepID=A0A9D4A6I6_9ROSI|nr:hypothetical protein J1N35_018811 [Gossypium stocksii]
MMGPEKTSEVRQTGDDEAINVIFLKKENKNGGYQRTWENEPNGRVEYLCWFRAGTNFEEKDDNCCSEWARKDVKNMGLATVELNMQDKEVWLRFGIEVVFKWIKIFVMGNGRLKA